MTNRSIEQLERDIEHLVAGHLAAVRIAVGAAVERALGAPAARPKSPRTPRRKAGGRRTPEEIAALGDRVYEAVCAQPGSRMTVLAEQVGATPRELHRPMAQLKRAGRVRSVGQRDQTRYFPMAAPTEG